MAVFLFAHQDDEFGILSQLLTARRRGRAYCVFMTTGVPEGADSARRNRESLDVLGRLGIPASDIAFAGDLLEIPDQALLDKLELAARWLKEWLTSLPNLEAIYVPAWEGGHPDHDALHSLGVQLCKEIGLLRQVKQFPLYNSFKCPGPFFRVMYPLDENGTVEHSAISLTHRVRFLRYVLRYSSQRKTWAGLFPFLLLRYMLDGRQSLQSASARRLHERPHGGALYYEKRRFTTWTAAHARIRAWLHKREA
ncbi:MAG TPA: PIG-L family deacetylase [Gammaproteobacteria bacterium]|nr:PIG-L family deacetylase [Gammaproteobacteria bacterium]